MFAVRIRLRSALKATGFGMPWFGAGAATGPATPLDASKLWAVERNSAVAPPPTLGAPVGAPA